MKIVADASHPVSERWVFSLLMHSSLRALDQLLNLAKCNSAVRLLVGGKAVPSSALFENAAQMLVTPEAHHCCDSRRLIATPYG